MGLIDDITLGRFVPGSSFLHRLDPRLKLACLPVLVIASFAAQTGSQRLALVLVAAVLILLTGHWRFFLRGIWALRWLFFFTVLLHLLFSPGRTLFGSAWLSLDGLLQGLLVCEQVALAVLFSSLLTLSTSPPELAAAIAAMLLPLGRFGVPVREFSILMMLSLQFIPTLREEALAQLASSRSAVDGPGRRLYERAQAVGRIMEPLVLRLVDRADRLALAVAAGEPVVDELPSLPPFWRLRSIPMIALLVFVLSLVLALGVLE